MSYRVNEVFYSLQGEGLRAGTANVFVRFAGCNLRCRMEAAADSPGGFDCDTQFEGGEEVADAAELVYRALDVLPGALVDARGPLKRRVAEVPGRIGVIFTGGEPALQLDREAVDLFRERGFLAAIETNGTRDVAGLGLDWITCSPKTAEHALLIKTCHELKYVLHAGQALPRPRTPHEHRLLSPACTPDGLDPAALAWCIKLCKEHPAWRLSCQQHKTWGVR